jgi:hypothetical protein
LTAPFAGPGLGITQQTHVVNVIVMLFLTCA